MESWPLCSLHIFPGCRCRCLVSLNKEVGQLPKDHAGTGRKRRSEKSLSHNEYADSGRMVGNPERMAQSALLALLPHPRDSDTDPQGTGDRHTTRRGTRYIRNKPAGPPTSGSRHGQRYSFQSYLGLSRFRDCQFSHFLPTGRGHKIVKSRRFPRHGG